jgi:septation ring formation regulator EzrA
MTGMKKPTLSDVLTTVNTLAESVGSLHEQQRTLAESLVSLRSEMTSEFRAAAARVDRRFDTVDRTLEQHNVALLELSAVATEHSTVLREHSGALGRIERRQSVDGRMLGDHERRITLLEQR